jgi:predicted GIY-YIG superfamily endonuclease
MVYLLHFNRKLHHAGHYLGATANLDRRIRQHRGGTSSACLMRAIYKAGIGFELVRTWTGDFELERQLKRRKNNSKLCPICQNGKG